MRRLRVLPHRAVWIAALLLAAVGCTDGGVLNQAPAEARRLVAEVAAGPRPESYRYAYRPISPVFMACFSGVEDVDGTVDFERRVVRLQSRHRPGALYSLDGYVLIDRDLLWHTRLPTQFAALELGAEPDPETLARVEAALGVGLSAQLARGAWPTHPSDLTAALVSAAASISLAESDQRTLRFVLDAESYANELAEESEELSEEPPPIFEVRVDDDGSVGRVVVRVPDPGDPAAVPVEGDGYSITYDYSSAISVVVPDTSLTTTVDSGSLPTRPTEVPCELEP